MCKRRVFIWPARPAVGEKGVCDDVSSHDRIGLPVGAQADACYGDVSITPAAGASLCLRQERGPGGY